jgi:hypothetical protein
LMTLFVSLLNMVFTIYTVCEIKKWRSIKPPI